MSERDSLGTLEKTAYRRAYSDGIIEVFIGLSLIFIGSIWILLPDYAGLAGVLPAVLVPTMIPIRKKFVEERIGYVRWSEPRRNKERRNLIAMVAAGLLIFIAGIAAFIAFDRSLVDQELLDIVAPALLAWLLALATLGLAFLMETWRFVIYAVVLALAGLVTGIMGANPGWPLVAGGAVIAFTGLILLIRFIRQNPRQEQA